MKKILLLLLLFTGIVNGQIVDIPDANFKNALLNTNCVDIDTDFVGDVDADSNNDGDIDYAEAEAVVHLIVSNSSIADLTGIEAFTNIEYLVCDHNQLTSLDVSSFIHLETLTCSDNPLSTLNFSGLTEFSFLNCDNTQISSLDFTSNPNFCCLNAMNCLQLISLNASGITAFSSNLFGSINIQYLNLHGCLAAGVNISSFLETAHNLEYLDLFGISNITVLQMGGPNLTDVNLSGCTGLTYLSLHANITSFDASEFVNLEHLILQNCNLNSLNVTGLVNLVELACDYNNISNLDLSTNINITHLYCEGNMLSELDVSGLSNLNTLQCDSNNISVLNLSNNPNLYQLICYGNPISSLDVSLNPNLNIFSCGSNALTLINMKNGSNETFYLDNISPNLLFICTDDEQQNAIQTIANTNAGLGCIVNSYCSFVPGGNYNKIVGNFIFDADNNGCDSNDSIFPFNIRLNVIGDTTNGGTFTNETGAYAFYTEIGNYSLVPQLEHAEYFNVTPQNPILNFPLLDNATQTQNFCITPSGLHPDIEVILIPIGVARPGFDATYKIVYKNKGTIPINATINLAFDDSRSDFIAAVPTVDIQNFGVLTWNFNDLNPFETRAIDFTLNLNTPSENPSLNGGDILNFIASSSIVIDEATAYDNTFELNQTVVNSYDPNDKTCLEGNTIIPENIGKYVHYNINFENIGTADAVNIVVKDIIDTTKFDINSLQLLYASHVVETKIIGNKVEFIFKNINLPSSIQNPIGGHGNVLFKIKTLPTLVVGDEVSNTANIFFDYNAPIQTNEARTTIASLSKDDFIKDETITVAPNPARNTITVSSKNKLKSVLLFDVQGRLLQTVLEHNKTTTLDISNQANGIYFLKVITEVGSSVEKIVKEN